MTKRSKLRTERWQRIALSATKQCGRTLVPKIVTLCEFRELVQQPWTNTLKLLFWEREGQLTLKQVYETDRDAQAILLVIGPEGGFSSEEADKAQQHGFKSVQLGRRILRSETAALASLSVLQFLWGDMHMHIDPLIGVGAIGRWLGDLKERAFKGDGMVLSDSALLFKAQGLVRSGWSWLFSRRALHWAGGLENLAVMLGEVTLEHDLCLGMGLWLPLF